MKNLVSQRWLTLIGIGLASFLGCIDFTIVNTALPAIQVGLHATMTQLQWIINIFLLALCACMVIAGRLADIYGRRLVLYVGMVGFGLTSLGAGFASNIEWLLLFRLGQGMCTAILYTASGAIVSNAFPKKERGKAMGILFGINGIGLAIGPVVGGLIVSALSWHWVFLMNVPLIIVSFMICIPNVKESRNTQHAPTIDWLGLIFLAISLSTLILALVQGAQWGWDSGLTISLFGVSLLSFIVLYFIEMRMDTPIIDFKLFANRHFMGGVIATFSLGFFYCLAFFLMPLYLHTIHGFSGYEIGFMLLPTTAVMALLSPVIGRATDRYGPKRIIILGGIFFILSAVLQFYFSVDSSVIYMGCAFAAMGVGWAAILGPATVAVLSSVPDHIGGVAMGSAWTLHNIGGVMGLALGTLLYHHLAVVSLVKNIVLDSVKKPADWINAAVANPEHAIQIIQAHTGMAWQQASEALQSFFLQGYQGAMALLIGVMILCVIMVTWLMKAKHEVVAK